MKRHFVRTLYILIAFLLLVSFSVNPIVVKAIETVPEKGFVKVAVSFNSTIALHQNGSVWSMPIFDNESPTKISEGVLDIDASEATYFIVKKDGSLWAWGSNDEGQFAQKDLLKSDKPVKIMEGVKCVATGGHIVAAIKRDKSVWVWGSNKLYESKTKSNKPKRVFNNAKALSPCYNDINIIDYKNNLHLLTFDYESNKEKVIKIKEGVIFAKGWYYIKADMSLWGRSEPTSSNKCILKDIVYTDSYISANCAIKKDGSLWAWGIEDDNIPSSEIAGYGEEPKKIMDGVKYADCSYERIVAVKKDGSLCAWGGISPLNHYSTPRNVLGNAKKILDGNYIVSSKDELWKIDYSMERCKKTKLLDNIDNVQNYSFIAKKDGTKWFVTYVNGIPKAMKYPEGTKKLVGDIIIKEDGTLWTKDINPNTYEVTGFVQCGSGIRGIKDIVSGEYSKYIYALKSDNSLWVWDSNVKSGTPKELQKPYKLAEDIKEAINIDSYVFAVSDSGSLMTWNIKSDNFDNTMLKSQIIINDAKGFGDRDRPIISIIRNDNSLWFFSSNSYNWDNQEDKYPEFINNDMKKITDDVNSLRFYNSDILLYKNGELYIKNFSKLSDPSLYYGGGSVFEKVMENVVSTEFKRPMGLALCKDNSLWEMGYYYEELSDTQKAKSIDIEPKKVLEGVKGFETDGIVNIALKQDGSLWSWGSNNNGQLGYDRDGFIQKPQKIMDNISDFKLDSKVLGLRANGDLLNWGAGFYIAHEQPYTRTPLNVDERSKTPVVLHRSYAAVRMNEGIDILVKITKPQFEYCVNVILDSGKVIKMKPCAGGYFEAVIDETKKEGLVGYRVQAIDSKGNKVETNSYTVQVVG